MWGDDEPGVPELQYEVSGLEEGESDRISRSLERDVANARVKNSSSCRSRSFSILTSSVIRPETNVAFAINRDGEVSGRAGS